MSFNDKHPELEDGEIFIGNVSEQFYHHNIGWKTKRMGNVTYTVDGKIIKSVYSMVPVFIQKKEKEGKASIKLRTFRKPNPRRRNRRRGRSCSI